VLKHRDNPNLAPAYLIAKQPSKESDSQFSFSRHFNPTLAEDSIYFRDLKKAMDCLQKHSEKEATSNDKVCENEFKKLRLDAFNNKLLYHHVHQRYCAEELAKQRNESAF